MGRTTVQADGDFARTITYNTKNQVSQEVGSRQKTSTVISVTTSTYSYGTGTGYMLGAATSVSGATAETNTSTSVVTNSSSTTTNSYIWREGTVQSQISVASTPSGGSTTTYTTDFYYDAMGQLAKTRIADGRPRDVFFTGDENGEVVRRQEVDGTANQDPDERWFRFAGKQLGYRGNLGMHKAEFADYDASVSIRTQEPYNYNPFPFNQTTGTDHSDFGQSYTPINTWSQGSAGGTYTVRTGDTLQSIAGAIYGDSSLWYKIAEANGLGAYAALAEGQTISLPTGVTRNTHNASTFAPYNPSNALGDISPNSLEAPKPMARQHCGWLGLLVVAAVTIAVTALTGGPLSAAFTNAFGGSAAAGAIAGGAVAGTLQQVYRTETSTVLPYEDVYFLTDINGQVIRREEKWDQGTSGGGALPATITYRFGGKEMGFVTNDGNVNVDYATLIDRRDNTPGSGYFLGGATGGIVHANFDANHITLANGAQEDTPGSWTVRDGDTLQGIAMAVWGDASQWYRIAQANGVAASGISEGQVLVIPGAIGNIRNNAETIKPYDPAKALGDVSPPMPKPPAQQRCGIFGIIVLTVIAVAVAAIVGPEVAAVLKPVFTAGTVAGSTAATVGTIAAGVVGGAVGGAAGSIVSQGFGVATGLQDSFSWKDVGLAALSGAFNGGLSAMSDLAAAGAKLGALGDAAQYLRGGGFWNGVVGGAVSSAAVQGIAVATGLQDSFDWTGVAAAGIGNGVGNLVGGATQSWGFGSDLVTTMASSVANAATRSAINGDSFGDNLRAAIPDAIGQVLGRALGAAVNGDGAIKKMEGTPVDTSTPQQPVVIKDLGNGQWSVTEPGGGPEIVGTPEEIVLKLSGRVQSHAQGIPTAAASSPDTSGRINSGDAHLDYAEGGTYPLFYAVATQATIHGVDGTDALGEWANKFGNGPTADQLTGELAGQSIDVQSSFAALVAFGAYSSAQHAGSLSYIAGAIASKIPPPITSTLTAWGDFGPAKTYEVPYYNDYGNTSVSAYNPSWWTDTSNSVKRAFNASTAPGYELRNSAYDDWATGDYGSATGKYLGSLALRTFATVGLPIELSVSAARGHGLEPTPIDRQDAGIISLVAGGFATAPVRAAQAPVGYTRAYRAVSIAEFDEIVATGRFGQGPNSMEGKWFADYYDDVIKHGNQLEGAGNYRIVDAYLPNDAPSLYRVQNLDGLGPARYLHMDDLIDVTPMPYNPR